MFEMYSEVIQLYLYLYICIHIYIYFFRFFSIVGYYKILNIVPCAVGPCCLSILFMCIL